MNNTTLYNETDGVHHFLSGGYTVRHNGRNYGGTWRSYIKAYDYYKQLTTKAN